ncbi:hypothetical protein [Stieleria varia]|uniref:hypothetical protein n=1 Tax=Stieleria varia TaxID=2528005 RepID=UPI0011B37288|nr:hypothetical protein [Stieleria varia]
MFQHLLHLLICITVLVCPATGGRCCGGADDSQLATTVSDCDDCCCHEKTDDSRNDAPVSPSCPDECHDCFCAGALPPAFETPMPQLDFDAFFVVSMDAAVSPSANKVSRTDDFPDSFKPPSGRALLTSYCTLLL